MNAHIPARPAVRWPTVLVRAAAAGIALFGACLPPSARADERELVETYREAIRQLNTDDFAAARKTIDRLAADAAKVNKSDPAYERAQELLKEIPGLREACFNNSAITQEKLIREALGKGDFAAATAAAEQALSDLTELSRLKPGDDGAAKDRDEAALRVPRARLLEAVASGANLDDLAGTIEIPAPEQVLSSTPSFHLPRADQAGVIPLPGSSRGPTVVQFFQGGHASVGVAHALMKLLHARFEPKGVRFYALAMDDGDDLNQLDEFLEDRRPPWPTALNDQDQFVRAVVNGSYYLPSYLVVTSDGRGLWISNSDPLTATAATVKTLLGDRPADDRPSPPSPWFPSAPDFVGVPAKGGGLARFQPAGAPHVLLITTADEGSELALELAALRDKAGSAFELTAAVFATDRTTVAQWSNGKPFPAIRVRQQLPRAYGPNYIPRIALISKSGRIAALLNPPRDEALRARVLLAWIAALTTGADLPQVDIPPEVDRADRRWGARITAAGEPEGRGLSTLIDGAVNRAPWRSKGDAPVTLLLELGPDGSGPVDRLVLDDRCNADLFELSAADSLRGPFESLGRFRRASRESSQAFDFPRTKARFFKVEFKSVQGNKPQGPVEFAELALTSSAAPATAWASLPRTFQPGWTPEQGLTGWERVDLGRGEFDASWRIENGRLVADDAARGVDLRATALLAPVESADEFHLRLQVRTRAAAAGVLMGFQDWDNFDRLLFIKGGSDSSKGNSLRWESWRAGQMAVAAIHPEPFDMQDRIPVEIVRKGPRIAVRLDQTWVFSVEGPPPLAGRVGLCTADDGEFEAGSLEWAASVDASIDLPPFEPLSTAAGAGIAWLSDQSGPDEPDGWAGNLLFPAAFGPPGRWLARRIDDGPPEIVFVFKDGGEVHLAEVGFANPPSDDQPRRLTRRVEVLVSRESVLRTDDFRSLGTISLKPQGGQTQWMKLDSPAPCRYLMLRLLENGGGDEFALARVMARLAPAALSSPASVADRSRLEAQLAAGGASEQEPNDRPGEATPLPAGDWVRANLQAGQTDWFRLPPPPGPGKNTLWARIEALPWLRLEADLTDGSNAFSPPLVRLDAAQAVERSWTFEAGGQLPQYVRAAMPVSTFGLVIDTSASMGGRESDLRSAVEAYLDGADDAEPIAVLRFNSTLESLGTLPADRQSVVSAVRDLNVTGNTALYQAVIKGMEDAQAVVLLSDGMNTVFEAGFTDLCRELRKRPVPLYIIGVGNDLVEFDANSGNTAHSLLANLSRQTGGQFYFAPESDDLAGLYDKIAADVRRSTLYRLSARWEGQRVSFELADVPHRAGSGPLVASPLSPPPAPADLAIPPAPIVIVPALPPPAPSELAVPLAPELVAFSPGTIPGAASMELAPLRPPQSTAAFPTTWGTVRVGYRPQPGGPPLPVQLLPAYDLIVDSSGSMAEPMEGKPKIDAAKRVVSELLAAMPSEAQVGLRLYGHWGVWLPRKTDPGASPLKTDDPRLDSDSELVVPIGLLKQDQRDKLKKWIDWALPRGKTPLVYSLLQARSDFPAAWTGPKTVILVSDGLETCGGKLSDVEAAYQGTDFGVVIHVVGFDIRETEAEEQLRAIARAGRGEYFSAADSSALARALRQAVANSAFRLYDDSGTTLIDRGLINGPAVELPPGKYMASADVDGAPRVPIELNSGQSTELWLSDDGSMREP
jgi:Mg-chelatase subunit ChlD